MTERHKSRKELADQARRDLADAGNHKISGSRSGGGLDHGIADADDAFSGGISGGGLSGGYDDAQGSQSFASPAGSDDDVERDWDGRERRDSARYNLSGNTRRADDGIDINQARTDHTGGGE